MSDEYNGYPNYETWNIMLHITNHPGLYYHYRSLANEYREESLYDFKNRIKEDFSEMCYEGIEKLPETIHCVLGDVIFSYIESVHWYDIAKNLRDDFA